MDLTSQSHGNVLFLFCTAFYVCVVNYLTGFCSSNLLSVTGYKCCGIIVFLWPEVFIIEFLLLLKMTATLNIFTIWPLLLLFMRNYCFLRNLFWWLRLLELLTAVGPTLFFFNKIIPYLRFVHLFSIKTVFLPCRLAYTSGKCKLELLLVGLNYFCVCVCLHWSFFITCSCIFSYGTSFILVFNLFQ